MKIWKSNNPKEGNLYAVQAGDYLGEMIIFVDKYGQDKYGFLSIPLMTNRYIPRKDFDFAIDNGIIEFVERVPRYVRKTSKIKFHENKKEL